MSRPRFTRVEHKSTAHAGTWLSGYTVDNPSTTIAQVRIKRADGTILDQTVCPPGHSFGDARALMFDDLLVFPDQLIYVACSNPAAEIAFITWGQMPEIVVEPWPTPPPRSPTEIDPHSALGMAQATLARFEHPLAADEATAMVQVGEDFGALARALAILTAACEKIINREVSLAEAVSLWQKGYRSGGNPTPDFLKGHAGYHAVIEHWLVERRAVDPPDVVRDVPPERLEL